MPATGPHPLATTPHSTSTSAMAPSANQQQPFPFVPPSMSAGDNHEMRDYYPPQDAPRPTSNQAPTFKPYLGLRARLSQIWINRWTILLLLVLVRLLFAIAATNTSIADSRREALSACTQVENIGSSMASMPYYMSKGLNEMTASGIEKAVNGLMTMLEMSVTGIEEIVLFVIHMMTSTYLCLITLAVTGSLHVAVELGQEITKQLNQTIDDVTNDMGNAVKTVTDGINSILSKINFNLPGLQKPSINLDSDIAKLKGLELPPAMQQDLQKLNASIPTFTDVQNFTDNLIRTPFEEVKKLIQNMQNFTFDRQLLPVPQKESLDFCSKGNSINDFFDDLIVLALKAKRIALILLIIAAIIACAPMAWMETRRYRKMERAALFAQGHEAMDVIYVASRPASSTIGLWLGKCFGSTRRQAVMRWTWAYATSVPMLFLLSLGAAGLFSCLCQYILLRAIEDKTPELTNEVADFAGKVLSSLSNASMSWSGGVNHAVGKLDDTINGDILGWVNTSTTAVNNTLNGFVSEMSKELNSTFGGTPLYDPIKDVLNCLIGLKVAGVQKGLTWVQDHAHVSFPAVANNTFSLSALADKSGSNTASELLANPNGKTKDEITEAVDYVINKLMKGIKQEALISGTLVLIWFIIAFVGFIYAATHFFRRDRSGMVANPYVIDRAVDQEPKPVQNWPSAAPPQYAANDFNVNKAAPYTLAPRPFMTFEHDIEPQREVVGTVGSHAVTVSSRPSHLRASSHGQLAEPSPLEDKAGPFSDHQYPSEKKQNPFA